MKKQKILVYLLTPFLLPADILFLRSENRDKIKQDLEKVGEENFFENKTGIMAFQYSMIFLKPFRNIFYFRTKSSLFLRNISRIFCKPLATVEINGDIGEGFRISHNYSVIHPQKAGRNFTVGHGVTVGKGKEREGNPGWNKPIIGDDVHIYSGATVFGGILIGNHVEIGAGAVVFQDIPDNCTVVGNPGRIVKKAENRTKGEGR